MRSVIQSLLSSLAVMAALTVVSPVQAAAEPGAIAAPEEEELVEVPNDWKVGESATYRFVRTREVNDDAGTRRFELHWMLDIDVIEVSEAGSVHRWRFSPDISYQGPEATLGSDASSRLLVEILTGAAPEMVVDNDGVVKGVRNLADVKGRLQAVTDHVVAARAKPGTAPAQIEALRQSFRGMFENDAFVTDQLTREARLMYSFGGGSFKAGAKAHTSEQRVTPIGNVTVTVETDHRLGAIDADGRLPFHSVETIPSLPQEAMRKVVAQVARGMMTPEVRRQVDQQLASLKATVRIDTDVLLQDGSPWLPTITRTTHISADTVKSADTTRIELIAHKVPSE